MGCHRDLHCVCLFSNSYPPTAGPTVADPDVTSVACSHPCIPHVCSPHRFRRFYVSGTVSLLMYMFLLFLLAIGYEYMRLATTRFDSMTRIKLGMDPSLKRPKRTASDLSGRRSPSTSNDSLAESNRAWGKVAIPKHIQLTRSLFYVANIAVSFFLMLGKSASTHAIVCGFALCLKSKMNLNETQRSMLTLLPYLSTMC